MAADRADPLPLRTPEMLVDKVKAGVAPPLDEPVKPLAEATDTAVRVPEPLLLNVVQSVELKTPLLAADAVGTFNVMTGVVVPVATLDERSVPVVPKVSAATEVTVPVLLV